MTLRYVLHRLMRRNTTSARSRYSTSFYRTNSEEQNKIQQGKERTAHKTHRWSHTSSTGRSAPGRKPRPATPANTPSDAQCIRYLPLHKSTLSSRNVAVTKPDLLRSPAASASAPRLRYICMHVCMYVCNWHRSPTVSKGSGEMPSRCCMAEQNSASFSFNAGRGGGGHEPCSRRLARTANVLLLA
jgi:hypothetical protein